MSDGVETDLMKKSYDVLVWRISQVVEFGTCAEFIFCGTESQPHDCNQFKKDGKVK